MALLTNVNGQLFWNNVTEVNMNKVMINNNNFTRQCSYTNRARCAKLTIDPPVTNFL